ncbi:MAG TPA: thermonuclease family protein [Gemmatimonadales bacterium]|nr:thermonuclease family protein [Gemmatimonadales bacterium]
MVRALALTWLTVLGCAGSTTALQKPESRSPRTRCVVARVTDGDTFRCTDGTRVRLLAIDSPEEGQGPVYQEARRGLQRYLVPQRTVELEADVRPTDQYGRTLAYVWVGDTLVNEAMVRDGWAVLYTVPPNVRFVERIRAAERDAREARRGLWANGPLRCRPADFRKQRCE